jgi:hypothetical protein
VKLALLIWLLAIGAVVVIASVILHATSSVVWVVPS